MFGIELGTAGLPRECDLGHFHNWHVHYIRSTVPLHMERKRPARSLAAWWAEKQDERTAG